MECYELSQPSLETVSPGGESGQLRLVAEEVLPELPHGRQHLVAPLALVQLLLPAEPLSLVGLEVSLELPDAAEREVAVPAAHRRRRRRGKVRPAAAAVDIIRDARSLEGQVHRDAEHVCEGVDLGCEGGGDGDGGAVQDADHRVQLVAADVGQDDGVLQRFISTYSAVQICLHEVELISLLASFRKQRTLFTKPVCLLANQMPGLLGLENDRNPNVGNLPNRNILLNANYSVNCRIAEYRITYFYSENVQLFGFGRIFG